MDKNVISDANVKIVLDTYIDIIASVPGVLQIYLFGSYANGIPHTRSDIDLMVLVEDNLMAGKMAITINRALVGKRNIPLDILVNTTSDFNKIAKEPSLQNRIKNEGVLLYAQ